VWGQGLDSESILDLLRRVGADRVTIVRDDVGASVTHVSGSVV
jgi:hypothetical protein